MTVISVIIPVLNMAGAIGTQLLALSRQTYAGDWEVIVADNGSTDGTPAVCQTWIGRVPALRIVDASQRPGVSAARNEGAAAARGSVYAFCDGDDAVYPGWLEACHAAMRDHDFVTGPLERYSLNPFIKHRRRSDRNDRAPVAHSFKPFAPGGNMAVSRRAFEAVGGFCESMQVGEDVDLSWRLQLAGFQLHFEQSAVVAQRRPPDIRTVWRKSLQWGRGDIDLYRRYRQHGVEFPCGIGPIYSDLKRAFFRRGRYRVTVSWRGLVAAAGTNYGRIAAWWGNPSDINPPPAGR